MADIGEKLADKVAINLNRNLWDCSSVLPASGLQHFHLQKLLCFSEVVAVIATASVCFTTVAYTIDYCRRKLSRKG